MRAATGKTAGEKMLETMLERRRLGIGLVVMEHEIDS